MQPVKSRRLVKLNWPLFYIELSRRPLVCPMINFLSIGAFKNKLPLDRGLYVRFFSLLHPPATTNADNGEIV